MKYFNVVILALSLFIFTAVLCGFTGVLLQFSPFFAIAFLLSGTLAVVLMVDLLQAVLFG